VSVVVSFLLPNERDWKSRKKRERNFCKFPFLCSFWSPPTFEYGTDERRWISSTSIQFDLLSSCPLRTNTKLISGKIADTNERVAFLFFSSRYKRCEGNNDTKKKEKKTELFPCRSSAVKNPNRDSAKSEFLEYFWAIWVKWIHFTCYWLADTSIMKG
jgi:hypothetical protein